MGWERYALNQYRHWEKMNRLREEQEKREMAMKDKRYVVAPSGQVRPAGKTETFATGATRQSDVDKIDYEGFMSPLVVEAYGQFMHFNRELDDGSTRASDNWQQGIPTPRYMKSMLRHVFDVWHWHRGTGRAKETIVWALCAVIFNASGYLHELLKTDASLLSTCERLERDNRELRRAAARD